MEESALEGDQARGFADLGVMPAHDAANRAGAFGVGDDQHLGIQRALHAIQRPKTFAGARPTDHQRASGDAIEVEGVHRLAELEHDVVGDVHHVVDRADAGRGQPLGEPVRRSAHTDFEDLRAIPRAKRRIFQPYVDAT